MIFSSTNPRIYKKLDTVVISQEGEEVSLNVLRRDTGSLFVPIARGMSLIS